jgi:hypothetical protein
MVKQASGLQTRDDPLVTRDENADSPIEISLTELEAHNEPN